MVRCPEEMEYGEGRSIIVMDDGEIWFEGEDGQWRSLEAGTMLAFGRAFRQFRDTTMIELDSLYKIFVEVVRRLGWRVEERNE